MAECIKNTCKGCIHFKICNDYVYLVGREDKVACPDYKSTQDVVPRNEVEKIFDEYGNYNFPTDPKENFNNTVVTSGQESTDFYCSFTKSKIQECPIQDEIKKAKQEVAREILGELSSHTSIGIRHLKELMAECDNEENKIWIEGKISELCNIEKIISEYEKKYIGENKDE